MHNTQDSKENVINFPRQDYAIFNENVRKSVKAQVVRSTEVNEPQADQVVDALEAALSQVIVTAARKIFSRLGERIANALSS